MTHENVRPDLDNALDLLQLITEDIEANFVAGPVNDLVKARATLTVSVLNILGDYLRSIRGGMPE